MIMIKEIEQAVQSIEEDIFNQTDTEYFNISVKSNGFCQIVSFIGIDLWSSEDDIREYIDDNEEVYEPIEKFLRRELMSQLKKLQLINI